ncbi:His Phos 1 domain containing protein [Trichuris trichiura]|uniref:His Phos 1 domain containing protein n=1 Tax=Trichuris trichiura TaxID=36087 RepID=A0A077ZEH3_TRITR|nr:His Phos 1 domain containing protein [Trichuris trichiura]
MVTQLLVIRAAESCDRPIEGLPWIYLYWPDGLMKRVRWPVHANFLGRIRTFQIKKSHPAIDGSLPARLPAFANSLQEFIYDPPLTIYGKLMCKLASEYLLQTKANFGSCLGGVAYCSPCLCCIQTLDVLLTNLGDQETKIRIEPGLADFVDHHGFERAPTFYTTEQFGLLKITRVDKNYHPIFQISAWKSSESRAAFCDRQKKVVDSLFDVHKGDVLLLVTQGPNLAAISHALRKMPLEMDITVPMLKKVPKLACCTMEKEGAIFKLVRPLLPPLKCPKSGYLQWDEWDDTIQHGEEEEY